MNRPSQKSADSAADANRPELLAPAGSFESLRAALDAGADAVYFGAGEWNMRAGGAVNFRPADLPDAAALCHQAGAHAYLTLNTIVYDGELDAVRGLCRAAADAGIDAVIAGDPAVFQAARAAGLPVHITVQANVSNLESVRFYAAFADVMVLARELPLGSIRAIADGIAREDIRGPSGRPVRIEVFAHGALCIGISGRCGMSLCTENASSNRGLCRQNCRRRYGVRDLETGSELTLDHQYILSPKDICTVDFLDRLVAAGASVFKIEGRGRPSDYVHTVVSVYREALNAIGAGQFTPARAVAWKQRLAEVFNRGFWEGGYYLGNRLDMWSRGEGSRATRRKVYLGKVVNYYSKPFVAAVKLETSIGLNEGDSLLIAGPSTGLVECNAAGLRLENTPVTTARQGDTVSFIVPCRVRPGDRVQMLSERIAEEESEQA